MAHDPDDEALESSDPGESDVMLPAAFAAAFAVVDPLPAAAFGFFATGAAVFGTAAGAVADTLAGPALPPGLAAPGITGGIPNPAGDIGFRAGCCGAGAVADAGVAACAGEAAAGWDAGALAPGAFGPSGSSVSSN